MAIKKKNKRKTRKQAHPTSPLEIIIREKAKKFIQAEKEYWKERNALREKMQDAAITLCLKTEKALPPDISSTVYGLKDGVAFVRHKAFSGRPNIEFRVLPITLDEWSQTGLIIPFEEGEISLAKAGVMRGLGHVTFVNCSINGIQIPYAELSHLK